MIRFTLLFTFLFFTGVQLNAQSPNFVWDGGDDGLFEDNDWSTTGNWSITNNT